MNMDIALWALVGYVIGSLPWGYWVARAKGVDITKKGSGNIGASNVNRVIGPGYAILVGVLDFLKGFIPPYLAFALTGSVELALTAAMFAGIGAAFSLFMRLRGGKGFAALAGGFIALAMVTGSFGPVAVLVTTWTAIMILTRIASLSNFVTFLTAIPATALVANFVLFSYAIFGAILLSYTLRKNIVRLMEGKELRVTDKFR